MSSIEGSYEARRSALPDRVEVRVRSERRRRWSDGDKLAIVRETLGKRRGDGTLRRGLAV